MKKYPKLNKTYRELSIQEIRVFVEDCIGLSNSDRGLDIMFYPDYVHPSQQFSLTTDSDIFTGKLLENRRIYLDDVCQISWVVFAGDLAHEFVHAFNPGIIDCANNSSVLEEGIAGNVSRALREALGKPRRKPETITPKYVKAFNTVEKLFGTNIKQTKILRQHTEFKDLASLTLEDLHNNNIMVDKDSFAYLSQEFNPHNHKPNKED